MMRRWIHSAILGVFAAGLVACVSRPYPDGLHWFRDSAEQKAAYVETYRSAADAARRLSVGLAPKTWGVILDIDETILDNSEYQKRLALNGKGYEDATWAAWAQEAAATTVPGAKSFIDTVIDELHGRVILVTNRTVRQCPVTEENLRHLSIRYSQILCDVTGDKNKNARFRQVIEGTTPSGAAAVNVLIWIGDNIQDFPQLTQTTPGDQAQFGVHYFVLPNPMYGSWVSQPRR